MFQKFHLFQQKKTIIPYIRTTKPVPLVPTIPPKKNTFTDLIVIVQNGLWDYRMGWDQ